jgi:ABC-type transport system involved in multi-copper enzyme maturation permease subunit
MMVLFSGLMVVAAAMLIASSRRGGRPGVPRSRPLATVVALTSAMGLLLSSATIYLTYRPYWYIFQRAILNGDRSQARDLRHFLAAIRGLPGLKPGSYLPRNLPVYFWAGVTLLGVIGLVLILLRHFLGRPRANRLQHNPRVP